ncbi:MAG TPA: CoB--CoM heterodisulfide reductase iron-sulfur subunit B family protein [Syntrophorhabdales bacterium]|nr:CoB--CoM heterodisulfide reductase iron-sulfur subunit B family protein [Syntrophorhabdales bacterium]
MKYLYYPGCSLKSTGKPYEESLKAVFSALKVPLEELRDWNCCGATAYMAVDEVKSFALSARNLALAESQGEPAPNGMVQLIAPCSACYAGTLKTQRYLAENADIRRRVERGLSDASLTYSGRVQVRHPLDVLINDVGVERIKEAVKSPLGARVACYYGCQIVRPYAAFDNQQVPASLDTLVGALGGTPLDWPMKTRCCGGSLVGTIREVGLRLNYLILREASRRGADLVATTCPLCQFGLECFQPGMNASFQASVRMPVAFFTQLVGLSFAIPERELGLQRLFVPYEKASIGG